MKRLILSFITLALVSGYAITQEPTEEVEMLQAIYGMQKKQIIANAVELSNAQQQAFWPLYEEYEVKRKELGKRRLNLIKQYGEQYFELDGEVLQNLINESMKYNAEYAKLINSYTKKISKSVAVKPAGQFYQLENYLRNLVSVELMNNFPFVGEIKKVGE